MNAVLNVIDDNLIFYVNSSKMSNPEARDLKKERKKGGHQAYYIPPPLRKNKESGSRPHERWVGT